MLDVPMNYLKAMEAGPLLLRNLLRYVCCILYSGSLYCLFFCTELNDWNKFIFGLLLVSCLLLNYIYLTETVLKLEHEHKFILIYGLSAVIYLAGTWPRSFSPRSRCASRLD